jgi:hypothetical protein
VPPLCGDWEGELSPLPEAEIDRASTSSARLDPAMRAAAGGVPPRRAGGIRVRAPLVSSAPLPPFLVSSRYERCRLLRDGGSCAKNAAFGLKLRSFYLNLAFSRIKLGGLQVLGIVRNLDLGA